MHRAAVGVAAIRAAGAVQAAVPVAQQRQRRAANQYRWCTGTSRRPEPCSRICLVTAGARSWMCAALGAGTLLVLLPGLGRPSSDLDLFAARLVDGGYRVVQPRPAWHRRSTGPMEQLTLHDLAARHCRGDRGGRRCAGRGDRPGLRQSHCPLLAADRPGTWCASSCCCRPAARCSRRAEIAEAIRLAQAVDTPSDVRARAVRDAWFAPGSDISVWLDGWSQPVMRAYLAAAEATTGGDWWTAGQAEC